MLDLRMRVQRVHDRGHLDRVRPRSENRHDAERLGLIKSLLPSTWMKSAGEAQRDGAQHDADGIDQQHRLAHVQTVAEDQLVMKMSAIGFGNLFAARARRKIAAAVSRIGSASTTSGARGPPQWRFCSRR